MDPASNPFLRLSLEPALHIFSYLTAKDLARCRLSSKSFNQLALDRSLKRIWHQKACDQFLLRLKKQTDPVLEIIGLVQFNHPSSLPEIMIRAQKTVSLSTIKKICFRLLQSSFEQTSSNNKVARKYLALAAYHLDKSGDLGVSADVALGLIAIASAYVGTMPETSQELLRSANKHADHLDGSFFQPIVLANIAHVYAKLGQKKKAHISFSMALDCFSGLSAYKEHMDALKSEIAFLQSEAGCLDTAFPSQEGAAAYIDEHIPLPTVSYSQMRALLSNATPQTPISVNASFEKIVEEQLTALRQFEKGSIELALKTQTTAMKSLDGHN